MVALASKHGEVVKGSVCGDQAHCKAASCPVSEQFLLPPCICGSDKFCHQTCGLSDAYVEQQPHINAHDTGCQILMVLSLLCAELTGKPANLRSHKR